MDAVRNTIYIILLATLGQPWCYETVLYISEIEDAAFKYIMYAVQI